MPHNSPFDTSEQTVRSVHRCGWCGLNFKMPFYKKYYDAIQTVNERDKYKPDRKRNFASPEEVELCKNCKKKECTGGQNCGIKKLKDERKKEGGDYDI